MNVPGRATAANRRRRPPSSRPTRPAPDRTILLPVVAGLVAVLALTAMSMLTGQDTTATVAVTAVGAIVTAALARPRRR